MRPINTTFFVVTSPVVDSLFVELNFDVYLVQTLYSYQLVTLIFQRYVLEGLYPADAVYVKYSTSITRQLVIIQHQ